MNSDALEERDWWSPAAMKVVEAVSAVPEDLACAWSEKEVAWKEIKPLSKGGRWGCPCHWTLQRTCVSLVKQVEDGEWGLGYGSDHVRILSPAVWGCGANCLYKGPYRWDMLRPLRVDRNELEGLLKSEWAELLFEEGSGELC